MAGYWRQTTETLARLGAVTGLCVFAGWMVINFWPATEPQATIREDSSPSEPSTLEILRSQVRNHPGDWRWSLLLARAQHDNGDREAAVRTLRPLQRLHPDRLEVVTLSALLALEADREEELIKHLNGQFESATAERRLGMGLLMADLRRMSGDSEAASDRYRDLIKTHSQRPEPFLAFALLKRDQGEGDAAIALLRKAIKLNRNPATSAAELKTLERRWALEAARNKPASRALKAATTP